MILETEDMIGENFLGAGLKQQTGRALYQAVRNCKHVLTNKFAYVMFSCV